MDQKCSYPRSDLHNKMATTYFLAISDPVLKKQKCVFDISKTKTAYISNLHTFDLFHI